MLAGGHTHFAMVRHFDGALVVNPGSVGLPFAKQEKVMRISPWAEYAIVDWDDGLRSVDLRRTAFDVDSLAGADPDERDAARRLVGRPVVQGPVGGRPRR